MKTKKFILVFVGLSLLLGMMVSMGSAAEEKININTAPKEVLMMLDGVGEAIADRIIDYRTAHPFNVPEDIMNVKGIGQKVFEANKDRICCSE